MKISLPIKTGVFLGKMLQYPVIQWRKFFGLPREVQVKRRTLHYHLDLHEGIDFSIFVTGKYEPKIQKAFAQITSPGDVVLDIGANIGAHAMVLGELVKDGGQVYAFEPTHWAYRKMLRNLSLNPGLKVKALHAALTDEKGALIPATVSSSWDLTRSLSEANALDMGYAQSTEGCAQFSIDQWVKTENIQKVNVIKLDVDGFETRVLRGAVETLKKFHPIIICEWAPHHFVDPEEPFQEMIHILRNCGYEFFTLDGKKISESAAEIESEIPFGVLRYVLARPGAGPKNDLKCT